MKEAKVERKSDREFVVSLMINGPAQRVFEAWTKAELFKKWWVPKEAPMVLESCEIDARTGGKYRLVFKMNSQSMDFFGRYLEVTAPSRMVWTNEESGEEAAAITTVTFEERNGATMLTVHDLYPSKDALDEAIGNGSTEGMPVQLGQLDEFIAHQK